MLDSPWPLAISYLQADMKPFIPWWLCKSRVHNQTLPHTPWYFAHSACQPGRAMGASPAVINVSGRLEMSSIVTSDILVFRTLPTVWNALLYKFLP